MIDYASTAQEIWEAVQPTPAIPFSPRWLRERKRKSDRLLEQLEQLNLKEKAKAPEKLRDKVFALAIDLDVKGEYKALVKRDPTALLDLVFEIQKALFDRGRYRELLICDEREREENWLP